MPRLKNTNHEEEYRDRNIFGNRLIELRKEKNLTQDELADLLCKFWNEDEAISPLTISSYERGRTLPTLTTLISLSRIFNCSTDYLLGVDQIPSLIEKRRQELTNLTPEVMPEYDFIIRPTEYEKYDGMAVYVSTKDNTPLTCSRWGLLNFYEKEIVFSDKTSIPLSSNLILFRAKPVTAQLYEKCDMFALNLASLQNERMVWVEPITQNREVRSVYRGYYQHNSNRTMLINATNGLALPYFGLNISYNAFSIGETRK